MSINSSISHSNNSAAAAALIPVSSSSSSNGPNMTSQACAACKFQRRRCPADCPLAPYFPAEANNRFLSCKRLFGVSNMLRFLRDADPASRDDTMKSLIYEAEMRDKDPVHGCLGVVSRLSEQVKSLQRELELTRSLVHQQQQHHHHHHHHQHSPSPPSAAASMLQASESLGGLALSCMGMPLTSFRHTGSALALDDPYSEFDSPMEHKYLLRQ